MTVDSNNKGFLFILCIFLLFALGIKNHANFPVNDDWLFQRQVESFVIGEFKINSEIDMSFVAQGLAGYMWSQVFGYDFDSLSLLTVFVTGIAAFGLYKTLLILKIKEYAAVISTGVFLFNPLIFTSALTFMTEIYFLMPFIWAIYFYIKYLDENRKTYFTAALVFAGISLLVRQVGLVLFLSFILCELFNAKNRDEKRYNIVIYIISLAVFGLIWFFWPKYSPVGGTRLSLPNSFIELKEVPGRIFSLWMILPYFGLFLSPLLLPYILNKSRRTFKYILLTAIPLALIFYKFDLFPTGTVFYIEELYSKTNFRSNFSLFDNVLFKILLSYLISVSILSGLSLIYKIKNVYNALNRLIQLKENLFLTSVSAFYFLVLLISSDLYDRYFLPLFVVLLFLVVKYAGEIDSRSKRFIAVSTLVLIAAISYFLNYEFYTVNKLKWAQAERIRRIKNVNLQIHVDGTYTKYANAKEKTDYTGLIDIIPGGLEYKCYIEQYTLDGNSTYALMLNEIEKTFERVIENPKVYGRKKDNGLSRAKNNLESLLISQEYDSYLYNWVGKRAFVGSWCPEE